MASEEEIDLRLSQIETDWKLILEARRGGATEHAWAIQRFFDQYSRAVYRYLLGALKDADAADELFQEFALRISRGSFRNADQSRGRFRNYLKSALINLVIEFHRQRGKRTASLAEDPSDSTLSPEAELEKKFLKTWRDELLARSWTNLEAADKFRHRDYFQVLKFQTAHPKMNSETVAETLNQQLQRKKPLTAAGLRKTLQRARNKFAQLLLTEVEKSLEKPTIEDLEKELVELELVPYCRSALKERRKAEKPGQTEKTGKTN